MRANLPQLTVLMTNFNHGRYLRQSLPAILRLPSVPFEVIIIDDCSTDESLLVLEEIARSDRRVQVHRNRDNVGVLENAIRLLQMATAEYVYFAAADDLVLSGFIEKSLALLAAHPTAGLCATLTRKVDAHGRDLGVISPPIVVGKPCYFPPARVRELQGAVGPFFESNTAILKREALIGVGGFRRELQSLTDSFAAQVVALRHGACFIPEILTARRMLRGTYSGSLYQDPASRANLIANGVRFIEGAFPNEFPRGYADQWRREMELTVARTTAAERRERRARGVTHLLEKLPFFPSNGAVAAGQSFAWVEWLVRACAFLPIIPPHVLRRFIRRHVMLLLTAGRRMRSPTAT